MLTLTRYSFFPTENGGGTQRFTEHAPARDTACDTQVCNCTVDVRERPVGIPKDVQRVVEMTQKVGEYEVRLSVFGEKVQFWMYWPMDPSKPFDSFRQGREHAYFWYNEATDNLQIEITGTGDGRADCFFGHLYFGNEVDVSHLMNGHSPSKIVFPVSISSDALWMHACDFGEEAMRFLESDTRSEWHDYQKLCLYLKVKCMMALKYESLQACYDQLDKDLNFKKGFEEASEHLVKVLDNLKEQEFYQVGCMLKMAVQERSMKRMLLDESST